uniref:Uncharacterized protein n=1 Tax=Timema poppense TaxID=170557 RepID=A0A7R9DVV5_TIMPO|nr:unnamed protein product [Timema poppensis]
MSTVNVEEVRPEKDQKKYTNPAEWKINKEKVLRYSPKVMPTYPTCGHRGNGKNSSLIKMVDIKEFNSEFYAVKTKASKDLFILKYCSTSTPELSRSRTGERESSWQQNPSTQEYIPPNSWNYKHRVEGVFKHFKNQGADVPVETRGGYRKEEKYRGKLESVIQFELQNTIDGRLFKMS